MTKYKVHWVVLHAIYALVASLSIFSIRAPQIFPDSESYRSANGNAPWGWISLSGAEYSRGWPIELLYSIFNTDLTRVWMQSTLFAISVIFLSYSFFVRFNKSRFGFQISLVVLLFGQLGILQSWNNYVSRESLSNTLLIICVGIFVLSGVSEYRKYIISFLCLQAGFSAVTIILKPTLYPIVVSIIIVQLIYLLKSRVKGKVVHFELRVILVIAFVLLTLLYATGNASNQNIGWSKADPEARTLEEISFSYVVSEFNPFARSFIKFLNSRPTTDKCSLPRNPIPVVNLGEPMIYAGQIRKVCPNFSTYIRDHYKNDYLRYLVTNPKEFISSVSILSDGSFSFVNLGLSHSVVQPWVGNLLLLDIPLVTKHMILFCLFVTTLIFVFTYYNRKKSGFGALLPRFLVVTLFIYSGLISIIFSVIFQPTHLGDLSRQSFSSNLFIRFCLIWLLIDFTQVLFHFLRSRNDKTIKFHEQRKI